MLLRPRRPLLQSLGAVVVAKGKFPPFLYSLSNSVYITRRVRLDIRVPRSARPSLENLRPKNEKFDYSKITEIEQIVDQVNTTLTPKQRAHVDSLKKQLKGANAKRSPYRDVPLRSEIEENHGFAPNIHPKADQLIDWALAHIPVKAGPRRSRWRKRHAHRLAMIKYNHDKRITETRAALVRKKERGKRIKKEVLAMLEEVKFEREKLNLKREARIARAQQQNKTEPPV